MSRTTMYVIEDDGSLSVAEEYKNGHGSGPQVWGRLAHKYLDGCADPDAAFESQVHKRHWITDRSVLQDLDALAGRGASGTMAEHDWRTYLVTCDYVIVRPEDFRIYGDAMMKFYEEHRSGADGQAFSIGAQAEALIRIADEIDGGAEYRGVCWRQTSVGDEWDCGEMTDGRRRAMMTDALSNTSLDSETISIVVNSLVDDWQPIEEYVPYNIDIDDRHEWLPGADDQASSTASSNDSDSTTTV